MAGAYPALNDKEYDLLKKQAWNWYNLALADGGTGLNPPNYNDDRTTLLKKIAYYTASLAD